MRGGGGRERGRGEVGGGEREGEGEGRGGEGRAGKEGQEWGVMKERREHDEICATTLPHTYTHTITCSPTNTIQSYSTLVNTSMPKEYML